MSGRFVLADPAATDALGQALARARPEQGVVYLRGDLGAGKSSLARALLRALGVTGTIRSPTYTLVERYPLPGDGREALHLDLYRIGAAEELEFLGLDDAVAEAALWLVEWPERGAGLLPPADLDIMLAPRGEGRVAECVAMGPRGAGWLGRVKWA
ncbi:tRNA (adenosine(37)-N6)-threonylcarbamoyltransferase complex ATPase subunit type 1 TsaE [Coralloluteibacterium stylophorae]|uniref:tRNA threonylcarbamoyladenosine biosynthesis protein TsaE n=1 Tax=Coralloluteibacterium stylophorae TaxID=1776034 RepID=A0A8J7VW36_9GAMM|nr:tRNA (adenosine(37)-N6)-threonylcarbamoyltransferase complex ATPase subunit type 1 TsaE [Coralloluteibacterium stylophorae]MBS7458718.1 tRNA (adenosine(37)-N6)-threonylcarbamoyltransferase complex ATPase subunit type 1 TsaE [Coralloluteibacterium stylophorae]